MAKYEKIVTTEAGLELLAAAYTGGTITFTAIKTGSGNYTGTEDLAKLTALKGMRQTFGITSVTRAGSQIKVRSIINNDNLAAGYNMTEIGLYAMGSAGTEILFAIIVAEVGFEDYLPPFLDSPASITMELYLALTEAEGGVTFTADAMDGSFVPMEDFNEHTTDAAIHVTAAERTSWNAKLGTAGSVSDTTSAFTEAATLEALTSGSKLSILFGTLAKAVSSLISHLANTSNPHTVTKVQVGLGNVDNTSDANKPVSTAQATAIADAKATGTTAQTNLTSHTGNASNPHGVTKAQVGLGNVPNVATNDQTPTYTAASANAALTSGEKLSVAFGKIAKAISSLISHLADTTTHITAAERTAWNAKVNASGTVANATNAVNADTLDGLHAASFVQTSKSVNVVVSTTAPADTTAVWIVPN